ncbi:MAG: hypothetical protein E3J72_11185 [Planctomycetota bacterium]|nr:MAG: hypothetical protein E3J72_11185 [Planctomycetota bacterium]
MKRDRIVFVLGAGASMPYGFPSGEGLKDEICDQLPIIWSKMKPKDDRAKRDAENVVREIAKADTYTIDEFLEYNSEYRHFCRIGIAAIILQRENLDKPRNALPKDDHWQKYLWPWLITKDPNAFPDRKATFITYNYDRSLEYAMGLTISGRYTADMQTAMGFVSKVRIIHVYGRLGRLFGHKGSGEYVPYGGRNGEKKYEKYLGIAANQIKTIGEGYGTQDMGYAWQDLAQARRVIFLGFGFNKTNLKLLKLDETLSEDVEVVGTAYGETEMKKNRFIELLHEAGVHIDCEPRLEPRTNLELLQDMEEFVV